VSPEVVTVSVDFNDEVIRGFYLFIDARTGGEKAIDAGRGHAQGPVIVFFQGHAQRPDDAYDFTSRLALLSRSGIVIVPVCDTPYGSDSTCRGDTGKEVILMEILRHALAREGMKVSGFEPITDKNVLVDGVKIAQGKDNEGVPLVSMGWSHGGILARRFASSYRSSVISLGQICPAGYEQWGPWGITGRFAGESMRILAKTSGGNSRKAFISAWGFTKGIAGDFFRSVQAAITDLHPGKLRRVFKDIRDCSVFCDSRTFPVSHLERISVIFARDDSCMSPGRQLGIKDPDTITKEDFHRFQTRFFSDVKSPDRVLKLRILTGTHLAPVTHSDVYAETILGDLGELSVR